MRAKKSLGQNFLTSVGAIQKIIASSDYSPGLTILEVGPGRGVLTEALLKKFDKVVAVEKDHELIGFLQEKFSKEIASGQFWLIEGDILELDPADLSLAKKKPDLPAHGHEGNSRSNPLFSLSDYAVVANIPYYITGQFLRIWLSRSPRYMVLMVQKEVAKRIVASDKKEGLLSISVKIYGQPEYIETIKRGSFYPIPNVDSAILKITLHLEARRPSELEEEKFFAILKAGFAHKRKLLISNLSENYPQNLSEIFTNCKIDLKTRAEDLSVGDWRCLAEKI